MSIPHQLSRKKWIKWFEKEGESPFVADQLLHWFYERYILDFSKMTNIKQAI